MTLKVNDDVKCIAFQNLRRSRASFEAPDEFIFTHAKQLAEKLSMKQFILFLSSFSGRKLELFKCVMFVCLEV